MNNKSNQPTNQPVNQNPNQGSRVDQPTPVSAGTQSQGQPSSGDLKQAGRELASDAKDAVTTAASDAKNAVTDAASSATSQVKEQVSDLTQNVQEQATNYLGEQKGIAADRLEGVASALRNVGQEFNERDEGTLAHYTDGLAEQIERFSGSLRDREIGSLVDDARQLAYRQPEWFVAGALAVGFALGRFFKSSQRPRNDGRGYDNRGYSGQNYGERGYEDRGYSYGNPSDYSEGFSGNYARGYAGPSSGSGYAGGSGGYYEGGTTSDYGRGAYRNPEGYSQGAGNPNANPYGNTYEAQVRGESGGQPNYQGSRDYDAGYRAGSQPEYRGSGQSTSQPSTEFGQQEETLAANKSTQSNKPQGLGQGDGQEGSRK